ncbi:hypothetical protein [Gilvimarinus agarilyticus]|uniref:hypothetical protein n=1 Tax=Gilvimarinus agarilyticus TaxID=679259 RepID=UPI00059F1268|nr:hypothetical protein [Gilvimarinus agarilyticus]
MLLIEGLAGLRSVLGRRALATLLVGFTSLPCAGQQGLTPPPEISFEDGAGVNLLSGYPVFKLSDVKIGQGENMLHHTIATYDGFFRGFRDNFELSATISGTTSVMYGLNTSYLVRKVTVGAKSQDFSVETGSLFDFATYTPEKNDGASLIQNADDTFTYVDSSGAVAEIGETRPGSEYPYGGKVTYPNGFELTITQRKFRTESVNTNTGLQLKYFYRRNTLPEEPTSNQRDEFFYPSRIVALNNAFDYCAPTATACSFDYEWPTVNYVWPHHDEMSSDDGTGTAIFKVIDPEGGVTTYKHEFFSAQRYQSLPPFEPRITQVKSKTSNSVATSTFDYANNILCRLDGGNWDCNKLRSNVVAEAKVGGAEWHYRYDAPSATFVGYAASTGPNGVASVVTNVGAASPRLTNVETPAGVSNVRFYQNEHNKVKSATVKGKDLGYVYDARGNLIQTTQTGVSGSNEAGVAIVQSAGYEPECNDDNIKWCNKPLWVKDAKNNQTDYEYYDDTGQIKSVVKPADANGVRPQTFYRYEDRYAWYKSASGYVQADTPMSLLVEKVTCSGGSMVAGECAAQGNQLTTRYVYGPDQGPNNLWLRGVERVAGGEVRRTCYQYDMYGNVVSESTPKAALSSCQ